MDTWCAQALRLFPAVVIVPTMQIAWTLVSIISGMVFYQEYTGMSALKSAMFAVGVAVSCAAQESRLGDPAITISRFYGWQGGFIALTSHTQCCSTGALRIVCLDICSRGAPMLFRRMNGVLREHMQRPAVNLYGVPAADLWPRACMQLVFFGVWTLTTSRNVSGELPYVGLEEELTGQRSPSTELADSEAAGWL